MKQIAPFLVLIAILIAIAVVIVTLVNYQLKKRIIDKGPVNEYSLQLMNQLSGLGSEMLKWGIILLLGGIGLVVLEFIPQSPADSPLPYGIEAIFIAMGFLTYYFTIKHTSKREN